MPRQRGKTRNLTFAWQKLDRAISNLNGECFTPKEILKMTGVDRKSIGSFLFKKTKNGLLERIKYACYRKVSNGNLTKILPMSFVAIKVWKILNQSDKPLILREISEIITEDTGLNLYGNIAVLLTVWGRRNILDKFGDKQPHGYQIKPDYKSKSRPPASMPF